MCSVWLWSSPMHRLYFILGSEVKIPTIGKRLAAECIDCVILYCIKFFLTYLLVTFADIK